MCISTQGPAGYQQHPVTEHCNRSHDQEQRQSKRRWWTHSVGDSPKEDAVASGQLETGKSLGSQEAQHRHKSGANDGGYREVDQIIVHNTVFEIFKLGLAINRVDKQRGPVKGLDWAPTKNREHPINGNEGKQGHEDSKHIGPYGAQHGLYTRACLEFRQY